MNKRILELAKQSGLADDGGDFYEPFNRELEAFYKLAHQDGQRAMRERAAKVGDSWPDYDTEGLTETIRALEVE